MQTVVADGDLAFQRLFLPHDEVDDVIFQFSFAAELLEPLGLSKRWGYLVALHDQQEVGLFFFGQVGEEIRCGSKFQKAFIYGLNKRRNKQIQTNIPLNLRCTLLDLFTKNTYRVVFFQLLPISA